jgi:hypothetical protein
VTLLEVALGFFDSVGVKGLILNEYNQPIPFTQVMIDERRPVVNVTPLGEFWRILLPGSYTLKVETVPRMARRSETN